MEEKRVFIDNWNKTSQLEIAIHPLVSEAIVINYPGISGDIDGFNNKYGKLSDFIRDKNIGLLFVHQIKILVLIQMV